ncbi:hypothetical protein D3C87_1297650 [compost metagenome]
MNEQPIEDELTTDVMLAEIYKMSTGSLTIIINEHRDYGHSIEDALAHLLNQEAIDTDRCEDYITSDTIVQITSNGLTDEEAIDIYAPTLEEAIGVMYLTLKEEQ